ncbi:MAG: protein kinase [Deltaproteobacteria bacterium]|nr:protein kinase [Deltaproteobacteria bacterium]
MDRSGTILEGKYRLTRRLGEGGMGVVYEADHVQLQRRCAVKFVHEEIARNVEVCQRFLREARAAAAIGHPGIVQVFDVGVLPDGSHYLIMEFLEGESLAARLGRERPLPVATAVEVVSQSLAALGAAHREKIVHRDLKPDNLFLAGPTANPTVKILDFGICKLETGEATRMTRSGAVIGTPFYMAPEQAGALADVDHRLDIYAMGVILYECLTGRLPFDGDNFTQIVIKILTERCPLPRALNPSIPPALEAVVVTAMERDRQQRYSTAEDMLRALVPWLGARSRARLDLPEAAALPLAPAAPAAPFAAAPAAFAAPASVVTSAAPYGVAPVAPAVPLPVTPVPAAVSPLPAIPPAPAFPATVHASAWQSALTPPLPAVFPQTRVDPAAPRRTWLPWAVTGIVIAAAAVAAVVFFARGHATRDSAEAGEPAGPIALVVPADGGGTAGPIPAGPTTPPAAVADVAASGPTPDAAPANLPPPATGDRPLVALVSAGTMGESEPDAGAAPDADSVPDVPPEGDEGEASGEAVVRRRDVAAPVTPDVVPAPVEPPAGPLADTLSREAIRRGAEPVKSAVVGCASDEGGTLNVEFVVEGSTGAVRSARATGRFQGTTTGACAERAARRAHFDRFRRPTMTFAYPYALPTR